MVCEHEYMNIAAPNYLACYATGKYGCGKPLHTSAREQVEIFRTNLNFSAIVTNYYNVVFNDTSKSTDWGKF